MGELELSAWAAPQERFEALRESTLLRTGGDLCDLAYANPVAGPSAEVRAALHAAIGTGRELDLQYTPYGGATLPRRQVAQQLRASHSASFRWRHIVLTPGAMPALNLLFRAAGSGASGGEVLVLTPCWLDYPLYIENLGLTPRMIPLHARDFGLDLSAIDQALSDRTVAVVFSQPANPTGRLYGSAELEELANLLRRQEKPPLLISDECHRDVLFDKTFHSPLSAYANTCIVYSFGKKLALQGQRLGYIAVSPDMPGADAFARQLERDCRVMGYCAPTALMQKALPALLKVEPDWSGVARQRALVLDAMAAQNLPVVRSDGTFFIYLDAGSEDDFTQTERLAARGVLALPALVFHHRGYFRIALTGSDEVLERALPVLIDVVAGGCP